MEKEHATAKEITMRERIETFLELMEKNRFYEAHEVLEEVWFPRRFEDSDEIKLLKGFINAAVSFELAKREREKPSAQVWRNYLKYRSLLYKTKSPHYNLYHKTVRKIDKLKEQM